MEPFQLAAGRARAPSQYVDYGAATGAKGAIEPGALALAKPPRRPSGELLLHLGKPAALSPPVDKFHKLPWEVLVFLAQFLEQRDVFAALATTSKTNRAGLMRTPDPLLQALFAAQQSRIKTQVDQAMQHIKERAAWQKMLKEQVVSVQKEWEARPYGHGVAMCTANVKAKLGRPGDAAAILQWSIAEVPIRGQADPEMRHVALARMHLQARDADQALAAATNGLALNKSFADRRACAAVGLAGALLYKSKTGAVNPESALAVLQDAPEAPMLVLPILAMVQHALGNKVEASAALDLFVQLFPDEPAAIAEVYAWCGEADLAFEWLEKVIESKEEIVLGHLLQSPFIPAEIRSDPRWLLALERLHRTPRQLAGIEFDVKLPPSRAKR